MFTDLFCYSKKLLYSHMLALLHIFQNVLLSQVKRIYYYYILRENVMLIYIDSVKDLTFMHAD